MPEILCWFGASWPQAIWRSSRSCCCLPIVRSLIRRSLFRRSLFRRSLFHECAAGEVVRFAFILEDSVFLKRDVCVVHRLALFAVASVIVIVLAVAIVIVIWGRSLFAVVWFIVGAMEIQVIVVVIVVTVLAVFVFRNRSWLRAVVGKGVIIR